VLYPYHTEFDASAARMHGQAALGDLLTASSRPSTLPED
jgi:hypothetical protein